MGEIEELRRRAFKLPCEDQFRLASFIAENVGYVLVSEMEATPNNQEAQERKLRSSLQAFIIGYFIIPAIIVMAALYLVGK